MAKNITRVTMLLVVGTILTFILQILALVGNVWSSVTIDNVEVRINFTYIRVFLLIFFFFF